MKKVLMILIFASCFFKVAAQQSVNDYKYVIVEKQFHFQNEANEYNLNELTRFLFKKNGFKPILESDVFPGDLKSNYCLALKSEVRSSGFLKTIVTITLKDCNNNILFTAEGSTKEKDLSKVYAYGIRKAFEDFENITYKYVPNEDIVDSGRNIVNEPMNDTEEVEKLKAEIEELKKEKTKKLIKKDLEKNTTKKLKDKINVEKVAVKKKVKKVKKEIIYLEAEEIENGYNLVDSNTKKVIHILFKTRKADVFIVKGNKGIIYRKDNKWFREYVKGKKTIVENIIVDF